MTFERKCASAAAEVCFDSQCHEPHIFLDGTKKKGLNFKADSEPEILRLIFRRAIAKGGKRGGEEGKRKRRAAPPNVASLDGAHCQRY